MHPVALIEQYGLERDDHSVDVVLRSVPEPWPFPPHTRVVPAVVAACDLAEAADARFIVFGTARLAELTADLVADWRRRPPGRRPVRPVIPTGHRFSYAGKDSWPTSWCGTIGPSRTPPSWSGCCSWRPHRYVGLKFQKR
jgi:hypothetical protein